MHFKRGTTKRQYSYRGHIKTVSFQGRSPTIFGFFVTDCIQNNWSPSSSTLIVPCKVFPHLSRRGRCYTTLSPSAVPARSWLMPKTPALFFASWQGRCCVPGGPFSLQTAALLPSLPPSPPEEMELPSMAWCVVVLLLLLPPPFVQGKWSVCGGGGSWWQRNGSLRQQLLHPSHGADTEQ